LHKNGYDTKKHDDKHFVLFKRCDAWFDRLMLQCDVVTLRQFYTSALGQCVRRDIGRAIMRMWKHEKYSSPRAGIGFSLPYLRKLMECSDAPLLSIMGADMGAIYWPADTENHTVLAKESDLPLRDNLLGHVLLCHCVEHSVHVNTMLKELHRVMKAGGKALIIVPNRMGRWSAKDNNPFGSGQPYQMAQMRHRAETAGLTYVRAQTALFYSPIQWRVMIKLSPFIEYIGRLLLPNFGGVLLIELEKQIYASIPEKGTKIKIPLLYPTAAPQTSGRKQS
jgi:SAM-dependent methyltransferase